MQMQTIRIKKGEKMKNKYGIIIAAMLLFLTACGQNNTINGGTADSKNAVYTSFYPIEYMTKRIAGDKTEVINIIPVSGSVHGWEPSAKQIAELSESKALFINGSGLESWMEKFEDSIPDLNVIDTSKGIELISLEESEHNDHHEGETEEEHKEHSHGSTDPHFWISPKEAVKQAENIYNGLVSLDKENEIYYKENFDALAKELQALDKEYEEKLSKASRRKIIVPHEAFSYIERDYGIEQIPLSGIHSEGGPTLAKVKSIVEEAKAEGITDVFYESGSSSEVADTIIKEIGGKALEIDSLEGITKEQSDKGENYLTILKKNLEHLTEATK